MDKNSQVNQLKEIYREMDVEGKKMMTTAASQLFTIQKSLENNELPANESIQGFTQEKAGIETVTLDRVSPTSRFNGVPGYFIMGFLLLFAAHFFWVTLISPALLLIGITPLIMVRIIITASIGMFCIGIGLVRFMFWKLTIHWMLLAIGAGILCVDPGLLTDLIGFVLIALIVAVQVIQGKREKATVTA